MEDLAQVRGLAVEMQAQDKLISLARESIIEVSIMVEKIIPLIPWLVFFTFTAFGGGGAGAR